MYEHGFVGWDTIVSTMNAELLYRFPSIRSFRN